MYSPYYQYNIPSNRSFTTPDDEEGGYMGIIIGILIILIGIAFGGLYVANSKYINEIQGVWEYSPPDSIITQEMTIRIDEEPGKKRFKAVGLFPKDKEPFLSYGTFPFFYMVSLYPINNPTPNLKITFIPYPTKKKDEDKPYFHLTLSRIDDPIKYEYKRIEKLKN